jgi:hypothetical protein
MNTNYQDYKNCGKQCCRVHPIVISGESGRNVGKRIQITPASAEWAGKRRSQVGHNKCKYGYGYGKN